MPKPRKIAVMRLTYPTRNAEVKENNDQSIMIIQCVHRDYMFKHGSTESDIKSQTRPITIKGIAYSPIGQTIKAHNETYEMLLWRLKRKAKLD